VILPIEKQIDDSQLTQIAPTPRLEVLIELLRHATDRALAQPAATEGVGVERADVLRRQTADVHPAHQALEISGARL
jgi:hypothetical protein